LPELLVCSRDGEPSHPVEDGINYILTNMPPDGDTWGWMEVLAFFKSADITSNGQLMRRMNDLFEVEAAYPSEELGLRRGVMDKYELFAVGHYFSVWPENISFKEFIAELEKGDSIKDCWPVVEYEGIPYENMAYLVNSMVDSLRMKFKVNEWKASS